MHDEILQLHGLDADLIDGVGDAAEEMRQIIGPIIERVRLGEVLNRPLVHE